MWGEREIIYLSLHCHHQNDSCIKMGSDESHFNVSVGSDGQSHKTVSANHNLFEEKGEPKRYRTEVLPLTNLTPYRYAKPARVTCVFKCCFMSTETVRIIRDRREPGTSILTFTQLLSSQPTHFFFSVALCPQRPYRLSVTDAQDDRLLRTGSPGRPSDFHTALEL